MPRNNVLTTRMLAACALAFILLMTIVIPHVSAASATATRRKELRLLDCTLDSKTIDDCDVEGYLIRVVIFSAPGIILAALFVLCCPIYCCGKYCCNCCGGSKQSPNFCCPSDALPARYSKGDLVRPRVFAVMCFIISIAALIWGLTGGEFLNTGMKGFAEKIIAVPDLITEVINEVDVATTVERYHVTNNSFTKERLLFQSASGQVVYKESYKVRDDLKKQIDDNLKDYHNKVDDFSFTLYIIFTFPVALVFVGLLLSFCNVRKYFPMCIVWMIFLIGIVLWAGHTGFCVASMVLGDTCAEIHGLANKQLNLLGVIIGCKDSQFSDYKAEFKGMEIDEAESACNGMAAKCYNSLKTETVNLNAGTIYRCPANFNCSGYTFARLLEVMENEYYTHPTMVAYPQTTTEGAVCKSTPNRCTVDLCAVDCTKADGTLSAVGTTSKQLYYNFLSARKVSNAIDTLGAKFSTCDSMLGIVIAPFSPPCFDLVEGLIYGRQATGLLGLCCIGAIFIFAWGAKRFIGLDQVELPQREDEDEESSKDS